MGSKLLPDVPGRRSGDSDRDTSRDHRLGGGRDCERERRSERGQLLYSFQLRVSNFRVCYNWRKLARSCLPASVRTDSGWNCTPSTFISLWRRPIMSPFAEQAEISRQSGRDERSTIS